MMFVINAKKKQIVRYDQWWQRALVAAWYSDWLMPVVLWGIEKLHWWYQVMT